MLSQAAYDLELAGNRKDLNFIDTYNNEFLHKLKTLLGKIDHFLNETATDPYLDQDTLKSALAELNAALESFDVSAMNRLVNSLQNMTKGTDANAFVRTVSNSILMGEYDEASRLIERFIRERL